MKANSEPLFKRKKSVYDASGLIRYDNPLLATQRRTCRQRESCAFTETGGGGLSAVSQIAVVEVSSEQYRVEFHILIEFGGQFWLQFT